ncbi:MAG: disulfide bond formation protein B [Burkholderiales bacterium]|nr:disulfide bond formation protein B [Burkholderiales bacterium]
MKPRGLLVGVAVVALAALAAALVSQHVYNMQPCPWCVLQRLIFLLIAGCALLGLLAPRPFAIAGALFALSGIATALWQHFVAAASASCKLTLADRILSATGLDGWLPEVFAAYASCAEAKVDLFGLPYEFYSLALFALLGAAFIWRLRDRRQRLA